MNKLSFKFIAEHIEKIGEEEDGDVCITIPDQIEILIDGKNQFEKFGMFPLDFFSQDKHFYEGELQIGICGCSCYRDHDRFVDVNTIDDMVVWTTQVWAGRSKGYIEGNKYFFDKNEYTEILKQFSQIYLPHDYYMKITDIILKELENQETITGYVYNMFMLYEYGNIIILYFKKDKTEEKYYIDWKENYETLIEEINKFKKDNIKKTEE